MGSKESFTVLRVIGGGMSTEPVTPPTHPWITITTGVGMDREVVVGVAEMAPHPHLRIIPMAHGMCLLRITNIHITIMEIVMG